MNTTGIQNYLSNVFRPFVIYDAPTSTFVPKLEMSNIDTYSGNTVSLFRADVGDQASNVYIGSNSGNPYIFGEYRSCANVTAVGYSAARIISNCSNSVYIGNQAGATSSNNQSVISIGYQSGQAGLGVSNIFIGTGTKSTLGSSNIFIGHGIDLSSVSNQIRIGYGTNIPIAADISLNRVGIGGITTPSRTLDVSGTFRVQDPSSNVLDFSNGFTRSTGGYASIQSDISVNAAATTIGQLKKGVVLISAVNKNDSADRAARMVLAYTTSNITDIGSNVAAGDASITFSTSNIQITDITNTTTYGYNITYFPLP